MRYGARVTGTGRPHQPSPAEARRLIDHGLATGQLTPDEHARRRKLIEDAEAATRAFRSPTRPGVKAASIIVGVVLAIVMVVAISEAGNGGSASVPSTGSASIGPSSSSSGGTDYSNDPASLLAARDGSGDTADYSAALTEFASLCTEDRVTVAGYADAAHDDLAKHGINMSRLQVLQQLALSVPASAAPTDCDGVTAAWLVLEEK